MTQTYAFLGNYVELDLTQEQAQSGSHQGRCDDDIDALVLDLRDQLDKIDPDAIRKELKNYGAWDEKELSDNEQNLARIVWIACGDVCDNETFD